MSTIRLLYGALIMLFSMAAVSLGLKANARADAQPFFMFAASGQLASVGGVLEQYVRPGDYLADSIARKDPSLGARVGRSNTFALPASIERATAGCNATAGLVIYDGEHWEDTPSDEQADMAGAVSRGKSAVKSAGCAFGIAPDGQFAGLVKGACDFDLNSALHRRVDWDDIDLYDIQAQRLLSEKCVAQGGIQKYVSFVTAVAHEVHAKNPHTKVSAQFSLRMTPPDLIVSVIKQVRGVVDGFYIAYPGRGGCPYCTPQNLAEVLGAIHG